MRQLLLLSVLLLSAPLRAAEYWVVSHHTEPFENVDALRAQGHTVRVLRVDLHKQFLAHYKAFVKVATAGDSVDETRAFAEAIVERMDTDMAARALKADFATRLMLKRLGVREVPVMIRYARGDVRAAYGSLDALMLAKRLGGSE